MKPITNFPESDRDEAMAWLAGALRWEQVLGDLRHGQADDDGATLAPVGVARTDLPARRAEAA